MNLADLTRRVAARAGCTQKDAAAVLHALQAEIIGTCTTGTPIRWKGFGVFRQVRRAARTCRRPQDGKRMEVAARDVITFKASKSIKRG